MNGKNKVKPNIEYMQLSPVRGGPNSDFGTIGRYRKEMIYSGIKLSPMVESFFKKTFKESFFKYYEIVRKNAEYNGTVMGAAYNLYANTNKIPVRDFKTGAEISKYKVSLAVKQNK